MFVLPSIYKSEIPYAKMTLADWYFIVTIYLMPTSFIGFLPDELLYVPGYFDYRLLTFSLALFLPFIAPRTNNGDFWKIPGIKFLSLLGLTIILRAVWSYIAGIPFFDIVSVLRWNLIWPVYALFVLHYASRVPYERLYAIMRMFLILFSIHVCLASISMITNIDFFLNKNKLEKSYQFLEMGLPDTNLRSFPIHIFVGTAFLFILFLRAEGKRLKNIFFLAAITLPFLFTRRMYSIILSFQTAAIYFITVFARTNKSVFRTPIIILCIFMIFYAIEPTRFDIWFDKIQPAIEEGIAPENVGTYSFRMSLLKDSVLTIAEHEKSVWGMGYVREYNRTGRQMYSYTLGADAPIASVIYCEGIGGLILRILPYLILLWHNIKRLISRNEINMRLYASAVIGIIIVQIPAYLQTAAICHYEYFFVPLALVELIIVKDLKKILTT
jgi:hypothetical protein